jgi:hypothetical protein
MSMKMRWRHIFNKHVIVWGTALTVSYAVVYSGVQHFSYPDVGSQSDVLRYVEIYRGEKSFGHRQYRVLTPYLARAIPDPPASFFNVQRQVTDAWLVKVKFGLVNCAFLAATIAVMFYYLEALRFSSLECMFGMLLFATARPVIQNAGIPMVEVSSYFFEVLPLYAIVTNNPLLLAASFLVGVFAKETTLIVVPLALIFFWSGSLWRTSVLVPGLLAYLGFRFGLQIDPSENYFNFSGGLFSTLSTQLRFVASLNGALEFGSSFGFLWLPAIFGFFRAQMPRWFRSWTVLLLTASVLMAMLLVGGQYPGGRAIFTAFPVVIPCALWGMRRVLPIGANASHP